VDIDAIALLVGAPIELVIGVPAALTLLLFVGTMRRGNPEKTTLRSKKALKSLEDAPIVGWGTIIAGVFVLVAAGVLIDTMVTTGAFDMMRNELRL
jgi:hypothetical protein